MKRPPIPRPSAAQLRALAILVDRGVDPLDGFYAATRGALVDYGWATSAAEGYRATEAGRAEHQLDNPLDVPPHDRGYALPMMTTANTPTLDTDADRTAVDALLERDDLVYVTTQTAEHTTMDRYRTIVLMNLARTITFTYVFRPASGVIIGRVRRDHGYGFDTAVAQSPTGETLARGDVSACVLALWQLDSGSLSPAARAAIARA